MSLPQSPTTGSAPGSPVGDDEELYRAIMYPSWWDEDEQRISSAAFKKDPVFSVDIASIAGSTETTLGRFGPGTGLASFLCRTARELGCDVRKEPDPKYPENDAHAHVYLPHDKNERVKVARKLVRACKTLRIPDIALLQQRRVGGG